MPDLPKLSTGDLKALKQARHTHTVNLSIRPKLTGASIGSGVSSHSSVPAMREWRPANGPVHTDATAVCVSGQIRTLPWMMDNFETAVLTPLTCGPGCRPGVFIHASAEWVMKDSSVPAHLRTTWEMLDGMVRRLRPVGVSIQTDSQILLNGHTGASETECFRSSCPSLMLRFAGCAHDIERHEMQYRRTPYRWIVRTRPDLLWHCSLPPPAIAVPLQKAGSQQAVIFLNDLFGMYTRAVGMRVLRLYERAISSNECLSVKLKAELHCCQVCNLPTSPRFHDLLSVTLKAEFHYLPLLAGLGDGGGEPLLLSQPDRQPEGG